MEISKEVSDYIKEQLQKGISVQEIKNAFIEKGWKESIIDQYISEVVGSNPSSDENLSVQATAVNASNVQDVSILGSGGELFGSVELLRRSWDLYRARWKTIIGTILIPMLVLFVFVLIGGLTFFLISDRLSYSLSPFFAIATFLFFLPATTFQFWRQLALIFAIVHSGENIGIKQSYKKSLKKIFPYFWLFTLSGSIIFGGFLLFVIPGIILSIFFVLGVYILAAENTGGLAALIKSKEYIKGHWWKVAGRLGFLIIFLFLLLIPLIIIESVGSFFEDVQIITIMGSVFGFVLQLIYSFVLAPLNIIYVFLIYLSLKNIKGDFEFTPSKGQKVKYILLGIFGVLVVPAILVAIVLVSLNPLKQISKARDVQRRASLDYLYQALEFYYIENGKYPESLDQLVPEQISQLPTDPKTEEVYYAYELKESGQNYLLCVDFEKQETECKSSARGGAGYQDKYLLPYVRFDFLNTNKQ